MTIYGVKTPDFPDDGCAIVFGASGGLGQATAGLIAQRGGNVVGTYHSREKPVADVVADIRKMGRRATAMACDVTDRASIAKVVSAALAEYGRIHSVISAGGLVFETKPMVDFSDEEFRGVIETDVFGFFNIAKETVPALRKGGGSITALITCAVKRTVPEDILSAVPKSAVAMMVRHLAAEEGRYGIRANAVGPGVVNGGMVLPMREFPETKKILDLAVEATPLHRLASCEEVAEAIAFLASAKAGYITGQHLMVDGGLSA